MKIIVIESSAHRPSSSNMLADEFIRGAEEKGHEVTVYDAAHPAFKPCLGCDVCGMAGRCIQEDGIEELKEQIRGMDMIVFVTPLYFFNVSAQLKALIDRFYSFSAQLPSMHKKSAFICAAWNDDSWTMSVVAKYYKTLCRYFTFKDQGSVLATGCGTRDMTAQSPFMQKAYNLVKSL